jgi:hypothetical protein
VHDITAVKSVCDHNRVGLRAWRDGRVTNGSGEEKGSDQKKFENVAKDENANDFEQSHVPREIEQLRTLNFETASNYSVLNEQN